MEDISNARLTARKESAAAHEAARETFGAQTPLAVIGLAAIGMILLINSQARPTAAPEKAGEKVAVVACADCGTVVAVRRAVNGLPAYIVEIQMLDGSLRTVQQLAAGFNVGDIVQINGNALRLRSAAS